MSTFGKRLKQLRINKGLTQEALASHFHTNKASISRYESDEQLPKNFTDYAVFFEVTNDYMLGKDDKKVIDDSIQTKNESFIIELLKTMKKQGMIDDIDNISDDMRDLIINAIKIEYKKSLKGGD